MAAVKVNGFLFQGTTADLSTTGDYSTIDYPGAEYNFVHSAMGGLAVGNYDSAVDHGSFNLPLGPGHAFIYSIDKSQFLSDVVYPGSTSNSVYGIWYNGGTSYTVVGGYSNGAVNNFDDQNRPIGHGYIADYDTATGKFTNWASYDYPYGANFLTHFQGISSVEKGVYTLSADSVQSGSNNPVQGSWVSITRNADGSFGPASWENLNYTGLDPTTNLTSNNSVYGNQVVGVVVGTGSPLSYQATINEVFTLSNVISGNGANGVGLYGASSNQVAQNYIGTDSTGTVGLGNGASGVLVSYSSAGNLIGGTATGGNDPTNSIYIQPPLGNVIADNAGDGVLINTAATDNQLSGNFIGTDATGDAALGNDLDGVAIIGADGNALIGCTFQQDPFVFYNVIDGNGGNGLRVENSNNTTIQANFFGMGADNRTAIGNTQNGVIVSGSSTNTVMGGPIPLGNVDAANGQNGIVVQDTASFFTSYNTFCGMAAFTNLPTYGNGHDGMLITSTGGNILIRTNVISRNGNDGIEIGGAASGVRVAGNIIGLNFDGFIQMGNHNNGVEIDGTAHDNIIGGPQPTFNVIPNNVISANGANGVAIDGNAHDNTISYSYIGTDVTGQQARGNTLSGVLLAADTYSNTVGSTDTTLLTVISANGGDGVEMQGTHDNTVTGAYIGTAANGSSAMGNGGDGVLIVNSSNNVIGRPFSWPPSTRVFTIGGNTQANNLPDTVANNGGNGVEIVSGNSNAIRANSIYGNGGLGIDLAAGANMNQAAPVLTGVLQLPGVCRLPGACTARQARRSTWTSTPTT